MEIAIWGTGGFAREVLQVALDAREAGSDHDVVGFLDGKAEAHGTQVHQLPVLGDQSWLRDHRDVAVVVGVGSPVAKNRIVRALREGGHDRFATLVHPRAWIGRRVEIGEGSIVCAGVAVTTDISIGRHVILNLNVTVGHDARLSDMVTVAPGVNISGNVSIDAGTDIGTGASIIQGVAVGAWAIVGAGSVVVRNLPSNVTAVGIPAKAIKTHDEGWHLR